MMWLLQLLWLLWLLRMLAGPIRIRRAFLAGNLSRKPPGGT